ncbi:MAG: hypothetical protein QXW56_06030 [Nitrososphaerota archaeon]
MSRTGSLVFLVLLLVVLSGLSYSVLTPTSPMPLTSPTYELNSSNGFYARSAALQLPPSGTSVTAVQVEVRNALLLPLVRTANVAVQVYDWGGNLIRSGSATVSVPRLQTRTVAVPLNPSVPYSSVARVVVSVS